jgi:hypothetical protein
LSEATINDVEDRRLVGNEKTINGMISGFPEEVIRTDLGLSDISVTYLVEERFFFLLLVAIRIPLAGNFSVDCAHFVAWARAGRHRHEHIS